MTSAKNRHRIRHLLKFLAGIWSYIAFALSFVRSQHQVLHVSPPGQIELGANVALFIHFDRRGALPAHAAAYIRALRENGFSVVFVTNSGRVALDKLTVLKELCAAIVVRRNVGYDFGAIREALDLLGLPRIATETLLIANDSVYGPITPLANTLARMDFSQADLWSATDSWQHRYHLQSYFLLAGSRALNDPAWKAFWHDVRQVSSKTWVVKHYEIRLTQKLLRAGLRCRALWPYQELVGQVRTAPSIRGRLHKIVDPIERRRRQALERIRECAAARKPMNPTAELWRQLLLDGFPFIKIELLRENPSDVADVADWREVVAGLPGADLATIERHLQGKMRGRPP
jgi:hypothetical protein